MTGHSGRHPTSRYERVIEPPRSWLELDLGELWRYRELVLVLTWRDIKVRYKQTVVGAAWAVLQPLLTMVIFALVFGRLARLPSDGLPYPLFFFSALVPWTYFSSALTGATASLVEHERVITKLYFPRLSLPVSSIMSNLVDLGISIGLLLLLMTFSHTVPGRRLLALPALVLLAVATAFGCGMWLSALNALYRDFRYAVPVLVQLWLFASPVAYSAGLIPVRWRWAYNLNPMATVTEGFRWAVGGRGPISPISLISAVLVVATIVLTGLVYFRHVDSTIVDRI